MTNPSALPGLGVFDPANYEGRRFVREKELPVRELVATFGRGRLWARLDELRLPEDYVRYEESAEGTRLGLFGDRLRVYRRYRAPRSFEVTCEEVRTAGERFSTGAALFQQHEGELFPVCSIAFSRRGVAGDINVSGPFKPGVAEQLGIPDRTEVLVDARMADY